MILSTRYDDICFKKFIPQISIIRGKLPPNRVTRANVARLSYPMNMRRLEVRIYQRLV